MFIERMSSQEREALYQTISAGAELLDSTGEPWWLSQGTLLGAWRHRDVIPWDDDFDVSFPRYKVRKLEEVARAKGWGFARLAPFLAKIWNPQAALYWPFPNWCWPFIDICLFDEAGKIIVEHSSHNLFKTLERDEIYPTQKARFGPLELPIPNKPEAFLGKIHPYWNIRPTSSGYNHRRECVYREPKQRMSIRELAQKFPLYNISLNHCGEAVVYYGEHRDWNGPVHLFASGKMKRSDTETGSYDLAEKRYIVLYWDHKAPETLVYMGKDLYRDPTQPFTLKLVP